MMRLPRWFLRCLFTLSSCEIKLMSTSLSLTTYTQVDVRTRTKKPKSADLYRMEPLFFAEVLRDLKCQTQPGDNINTRLIRCLFVYIPKEAKLNQSKQHCDASQGFYLNYGKTSCLPLTSSRALFEEETNTYERCYCLRGVGRVFVLST